MENYVNIMITGVEKYLNDLQYLAKENKKSLTNMINMYMILYVLRWSYLFDMTTDERIKLKKLIDVIVAKDNNLSHFVKDLHLNKNEILFKGGNSSYTNVNVPENYIGGQMFYNNRVKVINWEDYINKPPYNYEDYTPPVHGQ